MLFHAISNLVFLLLLSFLLFKPEDRITSFKLLEEYDKNDNFVRPCYIVPKSCHFKIERKKIYKNTDQSYIFNEYEKNIDYYVSKPSSKNSYPLIFLITGTVLSQELKHSWSIIDLHRFYLNEIESIGAGVITVERLGCTDKKYDTEIYDKHYCVHQRIFDHEAVIEALLKNPPHGWNGKIILWGISEGAQVAQQLIPKFKNHISLVILWAFPLFSEPSDTINFFYEDIKKIRQDTIKNCKHNIGNFYFFIYSCSTFYNYLKEYFHNLYYKVSKIEKILKKFNNQNYVLITSFKKSDFEYFARYLKNEHNNDNNIKKIEPIFEHPIIFWKSFFNLEPIDITNISIPIIAIAGEKDKIIVKYLRKNITQKNSLFENYILKNTEHQIRKNPKSLEITLKKIKYFNNL